MSGEIEIEKREKERDIYSPLKYFRCKKQTSARSITPLACLCARWLLPYKKGSVVVRNRGYK